MDLGRHRIFDGYRTDRKKAGALDSGKMNDPKGAMEHPGVK
ncbi:hypothetical protein [Nonomuraea sp. LPB2021202275-12-8]